MQQSFFCSLAVSLPLPWCSAGRFFAGPTIGLQPKATEINDEGSSSLFSPPLFLAGGFHFHSRVGLVRTQKLTAMVTDDYCSLKDYRVEFEAKEGSFTLCFWVYLSEPLAFPAVILRQVSTTFFSFCFILFSYSCFAMFTLLLMVVCVHSMKLFATGYFEAR